MTEAVGGAAQAQSIVDAITQKVPGRIGGNAHRNNTKIGHAREDAAKDGEPIAQADAPPQEPRVGERAVRQASTQTVTKAARSDHRDSGKNSDNTSFAATIDSLGKDAKIRTQVATDVETGGASTDANEAAPQTTKETTVPNSAPTAGWAALLTLRHIDLHRAIDGSSAGDSGLGTNSVGTAMTADALKPQSIAIRDVNALASSGPGKQAASGTDQQDAFPVETGDSAINTPIVVTAQQTHWLFATPTAPNAQVQVASADQMTKVTMPILSSPVTQTKGQDDVAKSLSNALKQAPATPASPVAVAAAGDAASGQPFDGQQGGGNSKPHDQTLANTDSRKVPQVSGAKPAARIVPDAGDMSASAPSVTQQVRTGVLDALSGDGAESTPSATPQTTDPRPAATAPVLRTIDLTLSPPDLGTIRLRLSLKSNALDIDAEASKASTAKLLDDDRKGLEQSLRDAGYDVSSLKIADAASTSNSGMNNQMAGNAPFQDPSQARANLAGRQGGNLQQGNGSTPNQSQHRPRDNPQTSPASDGAATRQSNAIYI